MIEERDRVKCELGQSSDTDMINERRNHHVRKLLTKLGGRNVPEHLQIAIKKSYSEFAEDIIEDINQRTEDGKERPDK